MMLVHSSTARQTVTQGASRQLCTLPRVQPHYLAGLRSSKLSVATSILASSAAYSDASCLRHTASGKPRRSLAVAPCAAQVKVHQPSSKQFSDGFWKAASIALVVGLRVTKLAITLASNLVSQVATDVKRYWGPQGRRPSPSQPPAEQPGPPQATPAAKPAVSTSQPAAATSVADAAKAGIARPFGHVLHVLKHLVLDPCTTLDRRLAVMETYSKTEAELSGHFQRLIRASCESAHTAETIYGAASAGQSSVVVDSAFWKHQSTQAVIEEEEALKRRVFEQVYYDLHQGGDRFIRNVRD